MELAENLQTPCGRSVEYCLAPETRQVIIPILRKNDELIDNILHSMWPTVISS